MVKTRKVGEIRNALVLAGIIMLGACLRVLHLGQKSYWWDEVATVEICTVPFSGFWRWLWRFEANMSFYYLLVRLWVHFGHGEAWVRLFSAVAAVASIPLIYAIGTRLSGKGAGLLSALLLSINAAHVAYAQEARSYALLMLLCLLSLVFFLRMRDAGNGNALAYVLVSGLAVYTHFFAVFFLFAQWSSILWLRRDSLQWKKFRLPISLTTIFIAPALFYMFFRRSGQLAFVSPTHLKDLSRLIYFLVADGGRFHKALALLYLLCFGVAVRRVFPLWRSKPGSSQDWGTVVMISCAVLPVIVTFVLSFWVPMFAARYLLICLPPLVLLAAQGLVELRPAWLGIGVCVIIIALSAGSLRWYYAHPKDDWRSLTAYLLQHAQSGDIVVGCPPGAEWPVQHYVSAGPSAATPELSYLAPALLLRDVQNHRSEGKPLPSTRFWMVDWGNSPDAKRIPLAVAPEYERVDEEHFPGTLTLALYASAGQGGNGKF
ncbi:MAG TPA: glycosyltransferase family 39 protein [Terriglobales bacterium]